jgi:type IV pilus modification protein PilV
MQTGYYPKQSSSHGPSTYKPLLNRYLSMNSAIKLHRCRGMTLVEVLIAALIIGIGLLGVAALQVTALQGASNANFRSRAIDLSGSLADRIRSNLTMLETYAPTTPPTLNCAERPDPYCASVPGVSEADPCSATQMAEFDLWEIRCRVSAELPGADLQVNCPDGCAATSPMEITVTWTTQDMQDAVTSAEQHTIFSIVPGAQPGIPGT